LFFQKIVREQGTLSLEEAVHRVTALSASRLGLADRGLIKPGYVADLVLFEEQNIGVDEDYMKSICRPRGIREVFVNGKSADTENGKLLRAGA
jgi:N-acyl-D-amino-acid deacylase